MFIDLILIIWMHTIGDFIFQTRYLARNKSTSHLALGAHCLLYTIPLFVISWQFAIINGILHYPIDFLTSKLTTRFYIEKKEHLFFNVIGIDQAIHITILILTYSFLKGAV